MIEQNNPHTLPVPTSGNRRPMTVSKPETVEVTQAEVETALALFNGGLRRQTDERNARGYTTFYHPKDSMRAVLEAFARHRLNATPSRQDDESVVEMARRICAQCSEGAGTINSPISARFLEGKLDRHPAMVACLAAIREMRAVPARQALEHIVDPIAAMQKEAEATARRLEGGVAYSLSNDPNYLKGIARAALSATPATSRQDGLREALIPFARAAKWWKAFDSQHRITTLHQHGDCLEVGDLRAAEAAIAALSDTPPPDNEETEALREALKDAYTQGALDVHNYWLKNPGEAPRGDDPEFGEAASDYATEALSAFNNGGK